MAEAIARGVLEDGLFHAGSIVAADVSPERRELFQRSLGIRAVADNAEAVRGARRVLLSVKPQQMGAVLPALGAALDPSALIISIAAGISRRTSAHLGRGLPWRVIRTMPNTPMLVGEGMVGMCPVHATTEDVADARRIFEAAGVGHRRHRGANRRGHGRQRLGAGVLLRPGSSK